MFFKEFVNQKKSRTLKTKFINEQKIKKENKSVNNLKEQMIRKLN